MSFDEIMLEMVIPEEYKGKRLDQALASLLPEYSRERIKSWIQQGECLVNGVSWKPKAKVAGGEAVCINAQLPVETECVPEDIPLDIVYEDDDILVINKPKGLVVHPGAGNPKGTLVNALLFYNAELEKIPRAGIVHRLDKDTTGLMVIAKTLQAHTALVEQLEARTVQRTYETIVSGTFTAGGTVDAPIGRHGTDRIKMAVTETGKPAITHYRVLTRYNDFTHLQCRLETGRTHQIRVHMSHIKHPIVGDKVYGGRLKMPKGASETVKQTIREFPRQALHAKALGLVHPSSSEPMTWEIPLPDDMLALMNILKE